MDPIRLEAARWTNSKEGGWYDGSNPRDPNPTMRGVTQTTYDLYRTRKGLDLQSVRLISDEEWAEIAYRYWRDAHLYRVSDLYLKATAVTLFDHSFNAGPVEAIRVLQQVLGTVPDGLWGPKTAAALNQIETWEDTRFADRCNQMRLRFYHDLARRSLRLRPNLTSWVGRVLDHDIAYIEGNI